MISETLGKVNNPIIRNYKFWFFGSALVWAATDVMAHYGFWVNVATIAHLIASVLFTYVVFIGLWTVMSKLFTPEKKATGVKPAKAKS